MLSAIWVLVRARLQIVRNTFWRGPLRRKLGSLALLAFGAFGAVAVYSFTLLIVRGLRSPALARALREAAAANPGLPADPAALLAALPGAVMLGALSLLVFSSFGTLLSALFLSGDIDALLVAPVPMRAVFVVKFFGGLLPQYALLLLVLGPVLLGYGRGMGYGPLYHLCAVLALLLTPLLPAGLAALLVMAVVRVLPARRAREIVGVLGGMVGLAFYLLSQLSAQIGPRAVNPGSLRALLAADMPLLPSAWAGRALVAAGEGRALPLALYGGLFLAASLATFGACLVIAERLYYAGWSNLAGEGGRVRRRRQRGAAREGRAAPLAALLPQQSRAILAKDVRLFTRDLRNLQALVFPIALAGIWSYQLLTTPRARPGAGGPGWLDLLQELGGAGVAFFICLSLSTALAGAGVSREGKGFWLLKLAPVSAGRLFLGKLALAFLPFPLVGTVFVVALGALRGLGPLALLQQWALLILCGLGCAAFAMAVGAAFPRLDWQNPNQQTTWQSGCLGALFFPLFVALMLALVVGAAVIAEIVGGGAAGAGVRAVGWLLAGGLTAAVVWLSSMLGRWGLERIEA